MDILRSLQREVEQQKREVEKLQNSDRLRGIELTEVKQELQRVKTIVLGCRRCSTLIRPTEVYVPDNRPTTIRCPNIEPAPDHFPHDTPTPVRGLDNESAPVRSPEIEIAPDHFPHDAPTPVHGPDEGGLAQVCKSNKIFCEICRRSFFRRGFSRHKYTCGTKRRNCGIKPSEKCPALYCKKHKQ